MKGNIEILNNWTHVINFTIIFYILDYYNYPLPDSNRRLMAHDTVALIIELRELAKSSWITLPSTTQTFMYNNNATPGPFLYSTNRMCRVCLWSIHFQAAIRFGICSAKWHCIRSHGGIICGAITLRNCVSYMKSVLCGHFDNLNICSKYI